MIIIRCEIEPSTNKKEKDTMFIWLSQIEKNDKDTLDKIEEYKKNYQLVIFKSGSGTIENFIHNFITTSSLKY